LLELSVFERATLLSSDGYDSYAVHGYSIAAYLSCGVSVWLGFEVPPKAMAIVARIASAFVRSSPAGETALRK
jgi:hypothetical protein